MCNKGSIVVLPSWTMYYFKYLSIYTQVNSHADAHFA